MSKSAASDINARLFLLFLPGKRSPLRYDFWKTSHHHDGMVFERVTMQIIRPFEKLSWRLYTHGLPKGHLEDYIWPLKKAPWRIRSVQYPPSSSSRKPRSVAYIDGKTPLWLDRRLIPANGNTAICTLRVLPGPCAFVHADLAVLAYFPSSDT